LKIGLIYGGDTEHIFRAMAKKVRTKNVYYGDAIKLFLDTMNV